MNIKRQPFLVIFLAVFLLTASSALAGSYDARIAKSAWAAIAKVEKKNNIPRGLLHSMSLVESGRGFGGKVLPWPYTVGVNGSGQKKATSAVKILHELDRLRRLDFKYFDLAIGKKLYKRQTALATERLLTSNVQEKDFSIKSYSYSRRFKDIISASAYAKGLVRLGYQNIDVGLMQINWRYHKNNFKNITEAFDPYYNVSYAVSYLRKHKQNMNWWQSVGRYHSGTEKYAKKYIKNVYAMYRRVHRLHPQV